MPTPIFVRALSAAELAALRAASRSSDQFTVRRAQFLLQSHARRSAPQIATDWHCSAQAVRNAIRAFNKSGLDALTAGSSRPINLRPSSFDQASREQLKDLLHRSPREFGFATSLWSLERLAQAAFQQGLTVQLVSRESVRQALLALGLKWRKARAHITSPDAHYEQKKKRCARLVARAIQERTSEVVYQDEVWWSRLAQPQLHSWAAANQPLQVEEWSQDKQDREAAAVACYGALRQSNSAMLLRFATPRPVGGATIAYLSWLAQELGKQGVRRVVVVWDNASWHCSKAVRGWIKAHNRAALAARRAGEVGVQLTPAWLPSKSPWLNPIEVRWAHGKRAVSEPQRKLTVAEMQARVCAYYKCGELATIDANIVS